MSRLPVKKTYKLYVGGELETAFKGAKSKSVLLGAIEEYL